MIISLLRVTFISLISLLLFASPAFSFEIQSKQCTSSIVKMKKVCKKALRRKATKKSKRTCKKITRKTNKICKKKNLKNLICPTYHEPVCGKTVDGQLKTFENICFLEISGAKIVLEGSCDAIPQCPLNYEPVCARTRYGVYKWFSNACFADIAEAVLSPNDLCD